MNYTQLFPSYLYTFFLEEMEATSYKPWPEIGARIVTLSVGRKFEFLERLSAQKFDTFSIHVVILQGASALFFVNSICIVPPSPGTYSCHLTLAVLHFICPTGRWNLIMMRRNMRWIVHLLFLPQQFCSTAKFSQLPVGYIPSDIGESMRMYATQFTCFNMNTILTTVYMYTSISISLKEKFLFTVVCDDALNVHTSFCKLLCVVITAKIAKLVVLVRVV